MKQAIETDFALCFRYLTLYMKLLIDMFLVSIRHLPDLCPMLALTEHTHGSDRLQ